MVRATNKYKSGASGHPWRTPAKKAIELDKYPLTSTRALVRVKRARTMRQKHGPHPIATMT